MNNSSSPIKGVAGRAACLLTQLLLMAIVSLGTGCGTGKTGKQKDEFFTSGSREADQRATQRMAKDEQLAGSGEGEGKKARSGTNGAAVLAEGKVTLFERLGGEQGISALVDDFTLRAMEDPRVNWARKGVKGGGISFRRNRGESGQWNPTPQNVATFKKHLVQFLSLATGGPPQYDGKEMKNAHEGMRISNPEFDAVIGDLKASMDKLQLPNKEQKELLAIIESTRPQIVTER